MRMGFSFYNSENTMRVAAILIVMVAMVFLSGCKETSANEKPYKAKTVEECINEKECVWYAFSNQLGLLDYEMWVVQGKQLNKWDKDIYLSAIGDAKNFLPYLHQKTIEPLNTVLSNKIISHKDTKYLMIFTSDIQKSINEWSKKLSATPIEKQRSKNEYNQSKGKDEGCYSTTFTDVGENSITKAITFIDTSRDTARYCSASHVFYVLGMWGNNPKQPFSYLSSEDDSKALLTKLDKFLIFLLYQPEFKDGQNAKEIKSTFEKIFRRSQKDFFNKNI